MPLEKLTNFLNSSQIKTDAENLSTYGRDWTKHYSPKAKAVLFPKNQSEVEKLVLWANTNSIGLVPSGGRTGLSAAAFALNHEVIVSFEKMNQILEWNEIDQTISCEPGVITENLQNFAKEKGYFFPVDFAARGSSQIGGNVATNAGGIKVIRYGNMRPWVVGIEVVTGAGQSLKLGKGLVKNATGYDLMQMFIGSEGTLGFITKVELKVIRPSDELSVMVFAVPELQSIMKIFSLFRKKFDLTAFEMFTDKALENVLLANSELNPFQESAPYYVLVEVESKPENESLLESTVGEVFEQEFALDGVVAQSSQQFQDLWKLREDISESITPKQPYKNDISVKPSKVPELITYMDEVLKRDYADVEVVWFGHIGDGNLHINMLKPNNLSSEDFKEKCQVVDKILFEKVARLGGSISAEHGVGLTKKDFLSFSKSEAEIHIMKEIKKIFDPNNIMNPGKIFDL